MNVDRPAGFLPRRHGAGGTPQRLSAYEIVSALPSNIYSGDPVVLTGTGRQIDLAAAGNTNLITGIFAGCQYVDSNGEVQYRPRWISGTVAEGVTRGENPVALVYDDPGMEFVIQVSGAAGLAEGDVGALANFVAGTGNNFTGRSAFQLDQTTIASAVDRQLRILGLARSAGGQGGGDSSNTYGEFADAVVQIRNHSYGTDGNQGV
jgi:hypothetical protein